MKDVIKRARLIYNPTSGQEIIKKNIAEVLDVLEDVGYETSAYQTTPEPLSAQKEAERRKLNNLLNRRPNNPYIYGKQWHFLLGVWR